ncbi:MAG TPA: hypothetical protein VL443_17775 [Cyclobacteriaceae bacterium]|jgi:hypothetical protein|nr:hypothetical protein [Cyclobacteriaceae bacterium]
MKTKIFIVAATIVMLAVLSTSVQAQSSEIPTIKILPSNQPGLLKILYVHDTDQSVEVKFFNDEGLIGYDKVEGGTFSKGFLKRYDVSRINSERFRIEITDENRSIRYSVIGADDNTTFKCVYERTTYLQPIVTASN